MNGTGPNSLPQFEDRLLYHLVDLTGDRPMGIGEGVTEADLAERLAEELDVTPESVRSDDFYTSQARRTILAAVTTLEHEGQLEAAKVFGPWTIRPTRSGRSTVAKWREEWTQRRQAKDREVQRRILEDLDHHRRANPQKHVFTGQVDVQKLCRELGVDQAYYLANAQRLRDQGKIAECQTDQCTLEDGYAHITEMGVRALEAAQGSHGPQRDAQEAWGEVARLRRRLQIAERDLPSLIADEELRVRCQDLLEADNHHDRVIREACVVLEDRVRTAIGAGADVTGVPLMERAFSPKGGPLRLSDLDQEQLGAMSLYRGIMAFFRNAAGHRLVGEYSQDDALRFVAFVDLLLKMVKTAKAEQGENV